MTHYTEFQGLKGDEDVSTTTLLVVAKRFIYAIDRTDCILYYRLVKMCVQSATCTVFYIGVVGSDLHSGQGVFFLALCVLMHVHRGLAMG